MILDKFRLDGKVAIVTGASRGLGQGMVIALAEAGANIVGVSSGTSHGTSSGTSHGTSSDIASATNSSSSSETAAYVKQLGRQYLEITADLRENECVGKILEQTKHTFGKIDILVNNAGTIRRNDLLEFTEQDWDEVMDVNLKTLFFLSQAVAREFVQQKSPGRIINIASMLSFQGGIRVASYTASKSAVKGLTMLMANELACNNITVNAIAPGYMATDNTQQLRDDEQRNAEILARIPAGRWGCPEDLAGAVVFLASNASNYVNGHTLAIDGGWLGR